MVATRELMEMLAEAIHFKASTNTMDAIQHSLLSCAKKNPFSYNQDIKENHTQMSQTLSPVPPLVLSGKERNTGPLAFH